MKTINATLTAKKDLETTTVLQNAVELGEALNFTKCNQTFNRSLLIQYIEYGEYGYERKSDWMRFVNKINNYNDTPIKRIITGDKKSLDYGGMIVNRTDIKYSEDGFLIEFKEPQKIVVEEIGDNYLTVEAKEIRGTFSVEWYSSKREKHQELGNISGICEIYLTEIEIIS